MTTEDERWYRRYRKAFGCKSLRQPEAPLVCGCDVCCAMSCAWDDAMRVAMKGAVKGVDQCRHPADQRDHPVSISCGAAEAKEG